MLDVLQATEANVARLKIATIDDVRRVPGRIVAFSPAVAGNNEALRDFLMRRVYRHPLVVRMVTKAEGFVERLFDLYCRVPDQLPLECRERVAGEGVPRVIADYLSGMTDRYLLEDYIRAFEPTIFPRG